MDEVTYNIIVNLITLLGYTYLSARQWLEIRRLPDEITPLRWIWFAIYMIIIFTLIPVMAYQITVFMGNPSEMLRIVSTIMSPTNRLSTLVLLLIFTHYKIKIKE